ncbi:P-loop ATPase, Sll1717 family [Rhodanobacter koreensis]
MSSWSIVLSDSELFGNEMAEDEEETLFTSYAYEREEFSAFLDSSTKLKVVRAYKGEGKSALLRWTYLRLRDFKNVIVHTAYANSIAPSLSASSSIDNIKAWKESYIKTAASAVGARLDFKFNDDVLSLREEAERGGFAERGFVAAILARLTKLPGGPTVAGAADPASALRRVAGANDLQIWIIVDDLDENFRDIETDCLKVMSALVAMRQLSNEVREIRFRTSIRPSTWAIIKRKFEALSKVEPYVIDLQWSHPQLEQMLANRVRSYLSRNSGPAVASGRLKTMGAKDLVALAFDDPMPWGRKHVQDGVIDEVEQQHKNRAPSVIVATLSRYRPRWMIELCKLAAISAIKRNSEKIGLDDLTARLEAFGKTRIDDLIAEFRAQCDKIELIIQSFKGKSEQFKTDELVRHIKANLSGRDIRIAGTSGRPSDTEIIRFLFQIGFLTARRDLANGEYRHYSFFDEPTLLSDGANDLGASWEVPSCFRQALQLKNAARRMPR